MSRPVLLAYATFILAGLGAGVSGVLLPAQLLDYGIDESTFGWTFLTSSAGFFLAGFASGPILHRLGLRLSLALGGAVFVAGALAAAARPPFVAFVAVQFLLGFGSGVLESLLNVYLAALPNAAPLLNRLHAFFGVGALLGPLLATWTLRATTWPAVWLILALLMLPLLTGFLLAYRDAAFQRPAAPSRGGLSEALRRPAVILASVFLALYVGLEIGVGTWAYTLLVEVHDEGPLPAGYTVSGYWLGLTAGRFLISPAATRAGLSPATTATACLTGTALAAALIWAAPVAWLASGALALLGFFLAPLFPTAMAVVPDVVEPRLVATAIGVMNGVSVLGGAGLPWLAGWLAQHAGIRTLMPLALTLALLQLLVWARMNAIARSSAADRASV